MLLDENIRWCANRAALGGASVNKLVCGAGLIATAVMIGNNKISDRIVYGRRCSMKLHTNGTCGAVMNNNLMH